MFAVLHAYTVKYTKTVYKSFLASGCYKSHSTRGYRLFCWNCLSVMLFIAWFRLFWFIRKRISSYVVSNYYVPIVFRCSVKLLWTRTRERTRNSWQIVEEHTKVIGKKNSSGSTQQISERKKADFTNFKLVDPSKLRIISKNELHHSKQNYTSHSFRVF